VAALTASAYAELVGKYPKAAGAALYTNKAFSLPFLTFMVAFAVMCSGITSASTAARTFGGDYLAEFVTLPVVLVGIAFLVVIALVLLSAWAESDRSALLGAGWGWLVAGGSFFVLWFIYPRGMGYGDVRLSGVLGIVLGYLGWSELLVGIYAGFAVGGVGGLLLSMLRVVDRKAYPFGPFMLVGAVIGVLLGPGIAAWYS